MFRRVTDLVADKIISDAITDVVHETSADLIHVHTEGLTPVAVRVAREQQLPVVVTLHGINASFLNSPYQKRRLRPALEAADRVILVGEPLREYFRTYIGSDRNFQLVPNGIDFPVSRFHRLILADDVVRLVSVSNLHEGKGIDVTLLALARLQSEGITNWTYRVIGDGRERSALLRLASELELTEKVRFIGAVRHVEIFNQLIRDDVFVLPSYREAFGIAYLEAMAVGLLTIGVMGEGPSQFIRNGENGVLVPPRDVEALAVALRNILEGDHNRWREIALEGQRTVQDFYTWDNHAKQLVEVYGQVIG
jgi:glycosyltransferase involved in cell wall biosynthesis